MIRRSFFLVVSSSVISLCVVSYALASADTHHEPSIADLKIFYLNFAVYVGALYLLFRKKIPTAWRSRSEQIQEKVTAGLRARELAEQEYRNAQKRLDGVAEEQAQIAAHIASEARGEVDNILEEARRSADRIRSDAAGLIAAEEKALKSALQRELADTVMAMAADRLRRSVTNESDRARRGAALANVRELVQ